jgi:hypothetical protein
VGYFYDFPFRGCVVGLNALIPDFAQAKRLGGGNLVFFAAVQTANQFDFDVCHGTGPS